MSGFNDTEHATLIWDQFQCAKRKKKDLHVVWLDLENAYGFVPHELINFALDFLLCASMGKNITGCHYADLRICHTLQIHMTGWQQQGRGIAMECSISPILFTASFEVILIGARTMARGVCNSAGELMPFP